MCANLAIGRGLGLGMGEGIDTTLHTGQRTHLGTGLVPQYCQNMLMYTLKAGCKDRPSGHKTEHNKTTHHSTVQHTTAKHRTPPLSLLPLLVVRALVRHQRLNIGLN